MKNGMYKRVLPRRTFLRGALGAAIALPFIDEMTTTSLFAELPEPPKRLVTCFFGNGVLPRIQERGNFLGADGPLAPLRPHLPKISVLRGVNMHTSNGHPQGGGATFVGFEGRQATQRGPSIDVVAQRALHPMGPPTPLKTPLLVASGFRRDHPYRNVHSWNVDGSKMDDPLERPSELFDRLFAGGVTPPMAEDRAEAQARERRLQRSVLDAVVGDYQHFMSDAGGLSTASQARISDHLDRIREIERRVFAEDESMMQPTLPTGCMPPESVNNPGGVPYGRRATSINGLIDHDAWSRAQNLMSDLYAMALRCDVVRFGNMTFQNSGERVRFEGAYDYNGTTVQFRDRDFNNEHHHEHWHRQRFPDVEWHTHYIIRHFAYFFDQLDDASYTDANGLTLLDNMMVMIGAELGNGSSHDTRSTFHTISGANRRFKTGELIDFNSSSVNLYNTVLRELGVMEPMGDQRHHGVGDVDSLLLA